MAADNIFIRHQDSRTEIVTHVIDYAIFYSLCHEWTYPIVVYDFIHFTFDTRIDWMIRTW